MEPPSPKKSSRRQVTSFSSAYSIAVSPMATISTRASRLGAAAACRAVVAPGSWVVGGGAWAGSENDGKSMGNLWKIYGNRRKSMEIYGKSMQIDGNLWEIYGKSMGIYQVYGKFWEVKNEEKWSNAMPIEYIYIYMMEDC